MRIDKNIFSCAFIILFLAILPFLMPITEAYMEENEAIIATPILGPSSISPHETILEGLPVTFNENNTILNCNISSYNKSAIIIIYYTENNTQTIIVPINSTVIESGGRYNISFVVNNTRSLGEFKVTIEGEGIDWGYSYGGAPTPTYTPTETPTSNVTEDDTLNTLDYRNENTHNENTHTEYYNIILALVLSTTIAGIALIGIRRFLK